MIKSIKLRNFQTHEDTLLELTPGVNVITGTSDSGKSSLVRAFNLVLFNRPTGSSYVRTGAADCSVDVSCYPSDEHPGGTNRVRRVREKGFNGYIVGGLSFNAVGSNVPEEVLQELNMSSVNIQNQHDPFFLLQASASEVAKELNEVAGLSCIDASVAKANAKVREVSSKLHEKRDALSDLSKRLEELAWVDEAQILVDEAEKVESEISGLEQKTSGLSALLSTLRDISDDVQANEEFLSFLHEIQLDRAAREFEEADAFVESLREILSDLHTNSLSIQSCAPEGMAEQIQSAEVLKDSLIATENKRDKLSDLLGQLEEASATLREREGELGDAVQALHRMENELGVCPLCKQPLSVPF